MNMKQIDLIIGNPEFLQPYWNSFSIKPIKLSCNYPKPNNEELNKLIYRLHDLEKNCNYQDKHIVYANGATQLISAITLALGRTVSVKPPYYYRFKNIVETNGLDFVHHGLNNTRIITLPNNPNNNTCNLDVQFGPRIYDLNYNWSIYTTPKQYNKDIMIFSLSKAVGLPSIRFAWAFIKNKKLARKVQEIIYHQTVHVSDLTINATTQIISREVKKIENKKHNVFKYGKCVLDKRWQMLKKLNPKTFKILNNSGMFAYCEGQPPENVLYLGGELCGETNKRFRLNIGCSEEKFREFIRIIK